MINHILKQIWNQRKSNGWLFGELLLVAVCLWYIVDFLLVTLYAFNAPMGFDIDHTYKFQFSAREEGAEGYLSSEEHPAAVGEDLWGAMNRLRLHAGVEAVTLSRFGVPYNDIINYMPLGRDTVVEKTACRIYYVTPEYFDVYRIPAAPGSNRQPGEGVTANSIVLTKDAADKIFEGQDALGKMVYSGDNTWTTKVGAICGVVRSSEFKRSGPNVYLCMGEGDIKTIDAGFLPWAEVSVRVKPEADRDFAETFMKENSNQVEIGNLYLQSITPVSTIREDGIREGKGEMNTRLSILLFLLINIFLGIVGTFWFRTRQRQGEMGLRMALGATRNQLRSTVLGEGVLLLTLAFVPAVVICGNIMFADLTNTVLMDNTLLRFVVGMLITYLLIVGMIIAGIWYPANEAASLEPAEALHYE